MLFFGNYLTFICYYYYLCHYFFNTSTAEFSWHIKSINITVFMKINGHSKSFSFLSLLSMSLLLSLPMYQSSKSWYEYMDCKFIMGYEFIASRELTRPDYSVSTLFFFIVPSKEVFSSIPRYLYDSPSLICWIFK